MTGTLMELLWPDTDEAAHEQLYYLLDGARDPAILKWLERSGLERECLYAGALIPRLKAAAPWLVRLPARAPVSLELLELGWGKAWGILLVAPAQLSMDALRRHCKKFLRVRTEDRRVLNFRFYDPRVLSVFLPTCDEGQHKALVGPLRRIIVEVDDGADWQVFR
ncbi:DUF4123 domain-containing protein [Pseudomonas putida]|uniref:DUF4123 domain-containing protein n=1 Tax=Pseudomonas putida TaxID=303 RepID=A0A1Q9RAH4_PSEPU|nr:DUF4123 domain-containing protein [Pseudomonas putida]OLS64325.1 hypothetical protein PSEMO_08700 [Pseudomonas putida]